MWQERKKNKIAVILADNLRPRRRRERKINERSKGTLVELVVTALQQTGAQMSRKAILKYLLLLANERPRTFAALLGQALYLQGPKRSQNDKKSGADLEKLLTDALEGWTQPVPSNLCCKTA